MTRLDTIDLTATPLASREWRLANLYTIRDADGNLVPFVPNFAQRAFYNAYWFKNHVLKARKLGFSTFIEIIYLDDLLFSPSGLNAGIIDYKLDDAKEKLGMFKTAFDHLDNPDIHPATWKFGTLIKKAIGITTASVTSIRFSNGSRVQCSTSLRGTTPQRLHVSELGKTAVFAPIKAREIITGALNAMTPGNVQNIESTHEGGKVGEHYRLLQIAMRNDPANLTPLQSRFHFFPWYLDPRYTIHHAGHRLRPEIRKYFDALRPSLPHDLTPGQMLWYDQKHLEQGHGMKKEFPSTPGEAFEAIADGAIYGTQMADLRAAGRITDFAPESDLPLFTFSDIGISDYFAAWLIQPVGRWYLVLDWFEREGATASTVADQFRRWEAAYRRPIACHYLPHDANIRDRASGLSYVAALAAAGIHPIHVVPRIPDVWLGIGFVRDVLPHCWFHRTHCDTPRNADGSPHAPDDSQEDYPSGVACLEGYSKDTSPTARLREMPRHDQFSHSADAFRTFAEARRHNLLDFRPASSPPPVKGGLHKPRTRR